MSKNDIRLGQIVYVIGERSIASTFDKCRVCLNHKTIIDRAGVEIKCPVCDGVGKMETTSIKRVCRTTNHCYGSHGPILSEKISAYRERRGYWIEMPVGSCCTARPGWYKREHLFASEVLANRYAKELSLESEVNATGKCVEPHHPEYTRNRLYYLLDANHLPNRKEGIKE